MKFIIAQYEMPLTAKQAAMARRLHALRRFGYLYPEVSLLDITGSAMIIKSHVLDMGRLTEIEKAIKTQIDLALVQNLIEQNDIESLVPQQKPQQPLQRKLQWK